MSDLCQCFNFSRWSTWYRSFSGFQPLRAKGGLERPDLAMTLCSGELSQHKGFLFPYSCLFLHKAVAGNMYRSNCYYFWTSGSLGWILGSSPSPWRSPTSARPGTDFRAYFMEEALLGIVKLVIWNFFLTSPDIWVGSWGHPHPHGGPQHQQGQGLILEHVS